MRPESETSSTSSTRLPASAVAVERRRQHDRLVEPLLDAGVELDVQAAEHLHVEGVAERAREGEPAARDRDDRVGPEAVIRDRLRQLARRRAEQLVGQDLALVGHRSPGYASR